MLGGHEEIPDQRPTSIQSHQFESIPIALR